MNAHWRNAHPNQLRSLQSPAGDISNSSWKRYPRLDEECFAHLTHHAPGNTKRVHQKQIINYFNICYSQKPSYV